MSHQKLFADMLKLAYAGPSEKKDIIEHCIPKNLGCHYDGKKTTVKELLLSTGIESTTLLQTEIANVIIEGAEPFKQARNAIKTIPMNSKVMQVNIGETGTYAPVVAEGAEIPIDTQDYGSVTFTAKKYGVRPLITKELVNDALFDVVALEAAKAGARLENALNRAVVDEILGTNAATAALCTDFGGSGATPITFLNNTIATIKNSGFLPDRVLLHPSAAAAYRNAMYGLNYEYGNSLGTQGVPNLCGCAMYETGVADNTATYVWGWGTNDYLGGYVFDSNAAIAIGMRQDIQVEQYQDPIRDLVGLSATMRFDVQCLNSSAGILLQY